MTLQPPPPDPNRPPDPDRPPAPTWNQPTPDAGADPSVTRAADAANVRPQRRRRTGWLFAYIGVGAFVALAVFVVASLVISSVGGTPLPTDEAKPDKGLFTPMPTPSPKSTGVDTGPTFPPPAYSQAKNGVYPLSEYAYFDAEASVTGEPGGTWTEAKDKWGDYWENSNPVCNLTQSVEWVSIHGDPPPDDNDGVYTDQNIEVRIAGIEKQYPGITRNGDDFSVFMPVSDGNQIELRGARYDYAEGGGFFLVLSRAMVWQESSFGFTLSCLGDEDFDHEGFTQDIIDGFTLNLK